MTEPAPPPPLPDEEDGDTSNTMSLTRAYIRNRKGKIRQEKEEEFYEDFQKHFETVVGREYCLQTSSSANPDKQKPTKCQCLAELQGNATMKAGCARFMMHYVRMNYEEERIWWLIQTRNLYKKESGGNRGRVKKGACYYLPVRVAPESDEDAPAAAAAPLVGDFRVCKNALMALLGFGRYKMAAVQKLAKEGGTVVPHRLTGKIANNSKSLLLSVYPSLVAFFEELKEIAEPRATIVVRLETGIGLREEEVDLVELPSGNTKRALYYRWCKERGWGVSADARGGLRKVQHPVPLADSKDICDWKTFRAFWRKNYKKVVVRAPSRDICGDCYVFKNQHKYRKRPRKEDNDSDSSEDESDGQDESVGGHKSRETSEEMEERIEQAYEHVRVAKIQRQAANEKIDAAKQSRIRNLANHLRIITLIGDYAQNMGLPHFDDEQPGETYYFSPLSISKFGLVDVSHAREILHAFLYHEGEGKKGGDNVASLIYQGLKKMDLLDFNDPIKELNLIFDNCTGQNKNKMVLRFATYLVEAGYFMEVNVIFLVKGHTKNAADRLFNISKKYVRRFDIFTMGQLIEAVGRHDQVEAHRVVPENMMGWCEFQDSFYRKTIPDGLTMTSQQFTINGTNPTKMQCLPSSKDEPTKTLQMKRRGHDKIMTAAQRLHALQSLFGLNTLTPPGIKPIKQVELGTKWRKVVPNPFKDDICPVVDEKLIAQVRNDKKLKKSIAKERIEALPDDARLEDVDMVEKSESPCEEEGEGKSVDDASDDKSVVEKIAARSSSEDDRAFY